MRSITLSPMSLKTALALGLSLTALTGWQGSAFAQDAPAPATPAAPPGPATQPPPPPGTTLPGPTQPPAAPAPPGTASPDAAAPAPAAPAPAPPNYNIQYNGLLDGYYLFNLRNPKDVTAGGGHAYYDINHNSPTLDLGELNVFKVAKPGGLGFKATLQTGDVADINAYGIGSSNGEARYKALGQLYGTYAFGGDGAGLDVGKFYTPFGYEVTEPNGNNNESHSLPYALIPAYHAGARIYTPVPGVAGLTATFYLVNAIFNTPTVGVQDDNKKPGYIGQINYTDPKGKFVLISELALGKDKFYGSSGADSKVTLNDTNFIYNLNANQIIGLDYTYREIKPNGGPKEKANGYGVYYRQVLTPKTAFSVRFSGYEDKTDGFDTVVPVVEDAVARKAHLTTIEHTDSVSIKPYEITATYELKPATNFTTRFEYRHDHSNVDSFVGGSGTDLTKKDQDTVEVAGIFTF